MAMKRYDQKFKDEALKLSDDIGIKKACEQLNLNYGTLAGWRNFVLVLNSLAKGLHSSSTTVEILYWS